MLKFNLSKIKGIRNENNDSQKNLAEKINISLNSLSQKERGTREFTITELVKICNVYQKDISIFFTNV